MIEFRTPQLADKVWMDQLLSRSNYRGCEYNFTNLFAWKDAYRHQVARLEDFLVVHLCGGLGCSYLYQSAKYWLTQAAKQGLPEAQYALDKLLSLTILKSVIRTGASAA